MLTANNVPELFCMTDDFCKFFDSLVLDAHSDDAKLHIKPPACKSALHEKRGGVATMPEMLANICQFPSIPGTSSSGCSISNGCILRYAKNAYADAEPLNRQCPNHHFFIFSFFHSRAQTRDYLLYINVSSTNSE